MTLKTATTIAIVGTLLSLGSNVLTMCLLSQQFGFWNGPGMSNPVQIIPMLIANFFGPWAFQAGMLVFLVVLRSKLAQLDFVDYLDHVWKSPESSDSSATPPSKKQ